MGIPFLSTLTSATDDTGDMVMILRRARMVVHMIQIIQVICCFATDDAGDMVMILRRVRMVVHMTQIIQMICCYM